MNVIKMIKPSVAFKCKQTRADVCFVDVTTREQTVQTIFPEQPHSISIHVG